MHNKKTFKIKENKNIKLVISLFYLHNYVNKIKKLLT